MFGTGDTRVAWTRSRPPGGRGPRSWLLDHLLEVGTPEVFVDLADVDGIDVASIALLADAKWRGEDVGVEVHVVGRPEGLDLLDQPGSVAFAPKPAPSIY